jgi:prepilin-type N-terminal cleavage/methylation domain-containing protein
MRYNQGFTLVETLVAIAILMVAIAGPLTIANQALIAALSSRDAMVATYLAQEGMESIKNIKDNDVAQAASGKSFYTNIESGLDLTSTAAPNPLPEYATPDLWNGTYMSPCVNDNGCLLYRDTSADDSPTGYVDFNYTISDSDSNYKPTPFTRYYTVTPTGTSTEFIVTVVVDWTDSAIPDEIRLQELMTSAPRS